MSMSNSLVSARQGLISAVFHKACIVMNDFYCQTTIYS